MPAQERKQKRTETPPSTESGQGVGAIAAKGKKLKDEMDKLVDEIDDVLEENAEDFVKSFVQKGGE